MLENVRLAFQGVWNHKLRSFLTMLGIIIGIAAIITIVSTIKGTNEQIKQNLIGSGTNAVVVQLYQQDYPCDLSWMGNPDGVLPLTEEARTALESIEHVERVSLYHTRGYADSVFCGSTQFTGSLYGIDGEYLRVYDYRLCYGRGMTERDLTLGQKVVLLDTRAAAALFAGKNPVGKTMEIGGEPFTIIGVVEQNTDFRPTIETLDDYNTFANTTGGCIFVPDRVWPVICRYDEPQTVAVKVSKTDDMTQAGKAVADYLNEHQITKREGEFSYRSQDLLEQAEHLQSMSSSTNRQLVWIAGISLLVGGIGVMNIMLVSVAERTSEIGLKKAIGAKKRRILLQFLTEAAVLTTLGGLLGIGAGIGLAQLLSKSLQIPVGISIPAILIAAAFSTLIGVIFGLLPAAKAARMNPIDALRRE